MTVFQTPIEQARALIVKGDIDGAIPQLSEVLNGDFFNDEALFLLGGCFLDKRQTGLAATALNAALNIRSAKGKTFPEALMNLGSCYKYEHKPDMAERIWLKALDQETIPRQRSQLYANLAALYINANAGERAVHYCDLALKEDPKNYAAIAHRGMACLELGCWADGWRGLNHAVLAGIAPRRQYPGVPEWDGSPGKVVIVYGDQGVGDEIFFGDCLRDMQRTCKRVIFDCHPRLEALWKRSFPEIEVHGTRKHLSMVDWLADSGAEAYVAISVLPEHFRREGGWSGEPWLVAKPIDVITQFFSGIPPKPFPRIGISWTGGTKDTYRHLRSLDIAQLEPILRARPDTQWFSLQYTPNAAREVCELEERTGIRVSHFPGWVECFDYDRTVSFAASLDLIITVCTSIHHVGGALGVPTWTLVPKQANWRYCGGSPLTDRLPWYNSARLFRQETDGDWSGPIERVAAELRRL